MYRHLLAAGLALAIGSATHASDTLLDHASDSPSLGDLVFAEETTGADPLIPNVSGISHDAEFQPVQYSEEEAEDGFASTMSDSLLGDDSLLGNALFFSGVEAYRGVLDNSFVNPPANGIPAVGAGFTNSAGLVNGINTTAPIWNGIRGQLGASIGVYDLLGRDVGNIRSQTEQQGFMTVGLYRPSDANNDDSLSYGIVYDRLWSSNSGFNGSGDFQLSQVRAAVGYAVTPRNEVGLWLTSKTEEQRISAAIGVLKPINQYNLYLKHQCDFGGTVMLYAGALDRYTAGSWIMGNQIVAPLSNHWGLYTNSAFMFPRAGAGAIGSDLLLWSVSAGLEYTFGGNLRGSSVSGDPRMPMFMVANNSTFKVTTSRTGF